MDYVTYILRGQEGGRIRATWRILFPIALVFVGLILGMMVVVQLNIDRLWMSMANSLIGAIGTVIVVVGVARHLDRRHLSNYGLSMSRRWWIDIGAGVILGLTLVGLVFGISISRQQIRIVDMLSVGDGNAFFLWMGLSMIGWLCVGFWEETLFRGIFITNAVEGLKARNLSDHTTILGAWLCSSVLFGLLHGVNVLFGATPEGTSLTSYLGITVLAGGLFGLSYILSGELAFPIGVHAAMNFAETNLFFGSVEPPLVPAVFRVEHTTVGASPQLQTIDPIVMIPVLLLGYVLTYGWFSVRRDSSLFDTRIETWRQTQ